MSLQSLIEQLLTEDIALTKGSKRVMNDKRLVANLADAVRDDARSHPGAFPPGSSRTFQKTPDTEIAQWFLENIDNIERGGYEGIIYSRDGVNSDWIVRRYIAGSHNWEDLTGVMNMNLRDWYLLKNRNMLEPSHNDLPKFNSVRDVGRYMNTHYANKIKELRDASINAARNKMAKKIKLVDNEDYRIYTTLNRAAGCALGLGTQWCTANSASDSHYHRYSNAAMLFQLFPYIEDKTGKKSLNGDEKYQFDAGSYSFMDILDTPAKRDIIRTKFPYIFTDLSGELKKNKAEMEQAFADLSQDPTLQASDFKIKTYEIDEEIEKLSGFITKGYFTNESRKTEKKELEPTGPESTTAEEPKQGQITMEKRTFRNYITEIEINEDITLGHIVQQYKPVNNDGEESPLTYGEDNLDEDPDMSDDQMDPDWTEKDVGHGDHDSEMSQNNSADYGEGWNINNQSRDNYADADANEEMISPIKYMQDMGLSKSKSVYTPEELKNMGSEELSKVFNEVMGTIAEDDMSQPAAGEPVASAQAAATLGGAGPTTSSGGQYPPGTAPTMPESINYKGNEIMENIDKDVAAMLSSLKKYDMLAESVAPVLGMHTLGEKDEGKHNNGKTTGFDVVAKKAAEEYGSKEAGERVAGAVRNKMKASGKIEETYEGDDEGESEKEAGNPWAKLGAEKNDEKKVGDKDKTSKGGVVTKTTTGLRHEGNYGAGKNKDKVDESIADPEVLEWMNRFSKLGNMKGYGR